MKMYSQLVTLLLLVALAGAAVSNADVFSQEDTLGKEEEPWFCHGSPVIIKNHSVFRQSWRSNVLHARSTRLTCFLRAGLDCPRFKVR